MCTAASSSEQSLKGAPRQGAPTSASDDLLSNVSVRPLSIDLLWVPSWGNPVDAPSRGTSLASWWRSLPKWTRQTPTLHFLSPAVARELKLLREPLPCAKIGCLLSARRGKLWQAHARTNDECILQAFHVLACVFVVLRCLFAHF